MGQVENFVGILGSGAREHAIAWRLRQDVADPNRLSIGFFPGQPFLETIGPCFDTFDELVEYGEMKASRRVLICGSEIYAGYGDQLEGWQFWGPSSAAAKLEVSKVFSKTWMQTYGIPTARLFGVVRNEFELDTLLAKRAIVYPVVMKYDGLLGGKGVAVVSSDSEAIDFYHKTESMAGDHFSRTFLFEERLVGVERSCFLFLDRHGHIQTIPASMDFKTKHDGDVGPNTGGMGGFTPAPLPMANEEWHTFLDNVLIPRIERGLQESKLTFSGVLYVGLMITAEGPKVLEFNVRLGDPEAQTVLPLLKTPFWEVVQRSVCGELVDPIAVERDKVVAGVVCATQGYSEMGQGNDPIEPLPQPWLADCPYHVFFGKLLEPRPGENGFHVGSGRIATVVFSFDKNASDQVVENQTRDVHQWIDRNKWAHIHFRRDLSDIFLKQRRSGENAG